MIFLACFLTLLIEVPFLAAFGYRKREELLITVCTNVVTNLCLNLLIQLIFSGAPDGWIYLLETFVVIAECGIYWAAFGRTWKLFLLTLTANCLSYGCGLLIF